MMTANTNASVDSTAGDPGVWRDVEVATPNGVIRFVGRTLGHASSHEDFHTHDEFDENGERRYARPGRRCSGCRWHEVTIYEADEDEGDARYLVVTRGPSIVPGERTFCRATWTDAATEVVELLVIRQGGQPTLPRSSARALAQAADLDDDLLDAYENRPVL